jgi:hypothetical protein
VSRYRHRRVVPCIVVARFYPAVVMAGLVPAIRRRAVWPAWPEKASPCRTANVIAPHDNCLRPAHTGMNRIEFRLLLLQENALATLD